MTFKNPYVKHLYADWEGGQVFLTYHPREFFYQYPLYFIQQTWVEYYTPKDTFRCWMNIQKRNIITAFKKEPWVQKQIEYKEWFAKNALPEYHFAELFDQTSEASFTIKGDGALKRITKSTNLQGYNELKKHFSFLNDIIHVKDPSFHNKML